MSDLTTKAAEIRAGLVAELRDLTLQSARHRSDDDIDDALDRAAALIEQQAAELAERASEVRCDGCGSSWTDADLRREREANPRLVSCCPERKPLTIDQWRNRATTAESERDELLREKERLEREARAGDFIIMDLTGTIKRLTAERDNSDAINFTAERRAREAMAGLSAAEATIASQSERIAVLEAALAAEREACAQIAAAAVDNDSRADCPFDGGAGGMGYRKACYDIEEAIRARSALAPLGEE